jgi:site-specific DNA-cytosine methylase
MLSAGGNNTAGQRERPPVEPSATLTGKGTAYWQVEPLCAECGCSDLVHDGDGFCAGPCGGTCGGRNPGWAGQRPATSVNGDPRIAQPGRHDPAVSGSQYGPQTIRVTVREAGILQSFPPDFPWAGDPEKPATKTMQYRMAGNSAPPLLVEAVVRALLED